MMTSDLHATVRERDGAAIIDLRGDIDRSADEPLERAYDQATADGASTVVLNFERADYINSAGIALIVSLLADARSRGVRVATCCLSPHYREIFEITRLSDFVALADDEDGALRAVQDDD